LCSPSIRRPCINNRSTRNSLFTGDVPAELNELGICITSLRGEHSRKPDEMRLIENLFDCPYPELFARTWRPGRSVWGNQTDKFNGNAA
jgi:N6-adenosine-specific RNA methylase IME4